MSGAQEKVYDAELQKRVAEFIGDPNDPNDKRPNQTEAAALFGISGTKLSQWRNSTYPGNIQKTEESIRAYFKIQDEKKENQTDVDGFKAVYEYAPISTSETIYKAIRNIQLRGSMLIVDGDTGVGKTMAAVKYVQDNPTTTVYLRAYPSSGSVAGVVRQIAAKLGISTRMHISELSQRVMERLQQTDMVLIIDEAQNLKFSALEEIREWSDPDRLEGKSGFAVVLIGNDELYDRMQTDEKKRYSRHKGRTKYHIRFLTRDIKKSDIEQLFPAFKESGKEKELDFLSAVSHGDQGIRGAINVVDNAVGNKDISLKTLEKMVAISGVF